MDCHHVIFGKGWNWPPKMVSPLFIHLSHCSIHTRSMFTIMNMYKTACFYYSSTFFYFDTTIKPQTRFRHPRSFFRSTHPHPPPKKTHLLNRIRNCRSKILKAPSVSCCKTRSSPHSRSRWPPTLPLDPAILRHPRETRRLLCPKHGHLCHPGWQQQPWDHHLK